MTGDGAISLLEADQALTAGLPDEDRARASRVLTVPRASAPAGHCDLAPLFERHGRSSVLLVVDGVLARDVVLHGRTSTQLLCPGDLVCTEVESGDVLGTEARFEALQPVTFAVLEGRFHAAARAWPVLSTRLHERFGAQFDRLSRQLAILALPRVEDRVMATLWLLAERAGRVRSDGVIVPVALTHERLGRLTAARRPTVTLAVRDLAESGDLARLAEGWLLRSEVGAPRVPSAV